MFVSVASRSFLVTAIFKYSARENLLYRLPISTWCVPNYILHLASNSKLYKLWALDIKANILFLKSNIKEHHGSGDIDEYLMLKES